MANHSSNTSAPGEFVAWLGRLLIALVAGEDLRVRQVIARAAATAHAGHGLNLKARSHARHDLAPNPRVE